MDDSSTFRCCRTSTERPCPGFLVASCEKSPSVQHGIGSTCSRGQRSFTQTESLQHLRLLLHRQLRGFRFQLNTYPYYVTKSSQGITDLFDRARRPSAARLSAARLTAARLTAARLAGIRLTAARLAGIRLTNVYNTKDRLVGEQEKPLPRCTSLYRSTGIVRHGPVQRNTR
ncbi:MAG: pentapeptide repeat-containing protein [Acidimicrobiales bacterium]